MIATAIKNQTKMKKIYGFDTIEKELRNNLLNSKLHHCNLLVGQKGIGKFSFIRNFCCYILAEQEKGQINQEKVEYVEKLLDSNAHTDFTILNPTTFLDDKKEKATDIITIDQVRKLIKNIQLTPMLSKNKVVIIDSIDLINREGQNAILKTLEEPPKNTYIFLICSDKNKILQTIISRSNIITVPNLSLNDWQLAVEDNIDKSTEFNVDFKIQDLYKISNASVSTAISIVENDFLNDYSTMLKLFCDKNPLEIQSYSAKFNEKKDNLFYIFKLLLSNLLQNLLNYMLTNSSENLIFDDDEKYFKKIIDRNNINTMTTAIDKIQQLLKDCETYSIGKQHCLNVLFSNFL